MKVSQIFEHEDDDENEPLVLTILRNYLDKGGQVRVYYRGQGGITSDINWFTKGGEHAMFTLPADGADRFLHVPRHDLEKMHVEKIAILPGSHGKKEALVLRMPRLNEATSASAAWSSSTWAEFKKLITGAGWLISRSPVNGLDHVTFGGVFKPSAALLRDELISLPTHVTWLLKVLARKLMALADQGLTVRIAPYKSPFSSQRESYEVHANDSFDRVVDRLSRGMTLESKQRFELFWSVSVPADIASSDVQRARSVLNPGESNEDQ
jgi:hypothetical protein